MLSIFLILLPILAEHFVSDIGFYVNLGVCFIIGAFNIIV